MHASNSFNAELCIAMAGLYHFHPELYRLVEKDPECIEIIARWSKTGEKGDHDSIFGSIKLPSHSKTTDSLDHGATPQPGFTSAHLDPLRGNTFWMQKLFATMEPTKTQIKAYILH